MRLLRSSASSFKCQGSLSHGKCAFLVPRSCCHPVLVFTQGTSGLQGCEQQGLPGHPFNPAAIGRAPCSRSPSLQQQQYAAALPFQHHHSDTGTLAVAYSSTPPLHGTKCTLPTLNSSASCRRGHPTPSCRWAQENARKRAQAGARGSKREHERARGRGQGRTGGGVCHVSWIYP